MPITGSIARHMPIFITDWTMNIPAMPIQINEPNSFLQPFAIFTSLVISKISMEIIGKELMVELELSPLQTKKYFPYKDDLFILYKDSSCLYYSEVSAVNARTQNLIKRQYSLF